MSPAARRQRVDQFFAAHYESGLPITAQCRAVFEAILEPTDHPIVEQFYHSVRGQLPQISRMMVHRIPGKPVSLGPVAMPCHSGLAAYFAPNLDQHHHLVCLDCGHIIDLEDPRLDRIPWPKVISIGFTFQNYHVHFPGLCARCR